MTALEDAMVLLVDDESDLLEMFSLMLQSAGIQHVTAQSAAEALVVIGSTRIDVLVSDWQLGSVSGAGLLAVVKKAKPTVPVIIATASPDLSAERARRLGADGFLAKPFSAKALIAAISKALQCAI